jgi:hypothetical protein
MLPNNNDDRTRNPTPWAVKCPAHGIVYLFHKEYFEQICDLDKGYFCPICKKDAPFQEDIYERSTESEDEVE